MGDIKTPRHAKGSRSLKILKRTSASVYSSRLPARSGRNRMHSHALVGARQIARIDRQPWEERVANILSVLEEHRHGRANSMYAALDFANASLAAVAKKKAEIETFSEELLASNEEMRASNEELKVITEEMERMHSDIEALAPFLQTNFLDFFSQVGEFAEQHGNTTMANQAATLRTSLDSILAYWRIGMTAVPFAPVHCEDILDRVITGLQTTIDEKHAEVNYDKLPMLIADGAQLEELFTEIILNSLYFHGNRPPEVRINARNIADEGITIPDSEIQSGWLFGIADNGLGIADAEKSRLFRLLTTGGDVPQNTSGAGLGLAIAWRIIRRHGGRIWLESTVGQGTTVMFTIPEREEI